MRQAGRPSDVTDCCVCREPEYGVNSEVIDEAIRRGKAGKPTVFASENGRSVDTASPIEHNIWRVDETLREQHYCAVCDGQAIRCSEMTQLALKVGR